MHIQNFDPYDFSKKDIASVPVYYKNLPWAPCVHIRIIINVGAFSDPLGKEGLAHFLEHMMFMGCPSIPDKKANRRFGREYTINSLNANTWYHRTIYNCRCLPENLETVLKGLKDMVFHSFFRLEDVKHEQNVITQEAWQYYKNERFLAYKKEYTHNLFPEHEYSRNPNTLGWPETIANITQQDVKDFHSRYYGKKNMTIVVSGAFEEKDLSLVEHFLSDIPDGSPIPEHKDTITKPLRLRSIKTSEEIGDPQEQLELSIERVYLSLSDYEDTVQQKANMLLRHILLEQLRDEHALCYGVRVSRSVFRDFCRISISVDTSEDKKELAETEIWKCIQEIIDGKQEEKYNTVHKLFLESLRSNERNSADIASDAAEDLVVQNHIVALNQTISDAEKITYDEIRESLKKTFDPEYCFTEIILPSKSSSTSTPSTGQSD